jgi:hypothetical protein
MDLQWPHHAACTRERNQDVSTGCGFAEAPSSTAGKHTRKEFHKGSLARLEHLLVEVVGRQLDGGRSQSEGSEHGDGWMRDGGVHATAAPPSRDVAHQPNKFQADEFGRYQYIETHSRLAVTADVTLRAHRNVS